MLIWKIHDEVNVRAKLELHKYRRNKEEEQELEQYSIYFILFSISEWMQNSFVVWSQTMPRPRRFTVNTQPIRIFFFVKCKVHQKVFAVFCVVVPFVCLVHWIAQDASLNKKEKRFCYSIRQLSLSFFLYFRFQFTKMKFIHCKKHDKKKSARKRKGDFELLVKPHVYSFYAFDESKGKRRKNK